MNDNREHVRSVRTGLVPGLIVAGIGVLFLLNNLNIVYIRDWWRFWPVILIAIGFTKLIDSPHHNERTGGGIILVVGAIFLIANLGLVSWRVWQLWPLVLIGVGVFMLFNRSTSGLMPGARVAHPDRVK